MRLQIPYLIAALSLGSADSDAGAALPEHAARRAEAFRRMPDGILLVPSESFVFGGPQLAMTGYAQDPDFLYLTGLESAAGTVLALDGAARESWLFVPEKLPGLAGRLARLSVAPGVESQKRLGIDHVVARKELAGFLVRRQEDRPELLLYYRGVESGHGFPLDIALDDPAAAWNHAMSELWEGKRIRPADPILDGMRQIKSPAEVEALRRAGKASAQALRAGMAALRSERRQREAEAEVVSACIAAGAEGPSFWPWVMSGPNGAFPAPLESLADYRYLDRAMRAGELVRVDVGCDVDHYKGDVGRTVPVSGRFDPGQRETWELLLAAYRAGLAVIRDGVRIDDVLAASRSEVKRRQPSLATPLGRKAAETLLAADGFQYWQIHGVGLDAAEGLPEILRTDMVVAFEPIFSVEGQGFYLEDMLRVTADGHELLTPGLPYSASEIEKAKRGRN